MDQEPEERPAILYFGNDWFADNRTSSHHVARFLATRFRVYYIETGGLRVPKTSGRDLKRMMSKVVRFFRGVRRADEDLNLFVQPLLLVPLQRFALVRWFNRLFVLFTLHWIIWRHRLGRPILWLVQPHVPYLLGRLNEQLSVYYCVDDHAGFPHVNADVIRAMDEETTRKADLVFVTSETLLEGKLRLNPNTHVSPHGVDTEHFARAQEESLERPTDIDSLPGPVIGYFGLIEAWVDLDLVDFLAAARPQWTFALIGRVAIPNEHVPRRSNIHFLGKKPYEQLPAYGKKFDATIIPFRLNQMTWHINPLKLREYLAMGKPVVAVRIPEIEKFADIVSIAGSPKEFLAHLDAAVARPPTKEDVQRRIAHVASSSWHALLSQVLTVVNHNLDKKVFDVSGESRVRQGAAIEGARLL